MKPYLISVKFMNGLGGWEVAFLDPAGVEHRATNHFGEHSDLLPTHVAFYRQDGGRGTHSRTECTSFLVDAILDVVGSPASALYNLNEKLVEIMATARKSLGAS